MNLFNAMVLTGTLATVGSFGLVSTGVSGKVTAGSGIRLAGTSVQAEDVTPVPPSCDMATCSLVDETQKTAYGPIDNWCRTSTSPPGTPDFNANVYYGNCWHYHCDEGDFYSFDGWVLQVYKCAWDEAPLPTHPCPNATCDPKCDPRSNPNCIPAGSG